MVPRIAVVAALMMAGGCGRPPVVSAPAPEGALACAVAHAEAAGFQIVEGTVDRGSVRLIRDVEPTPAVSRGDPPPSDVGAVLLARAADTTSQEQLVFRYTRGQLEATAVAMSGSVTNDQESVGTREQTALILNLCAADPSALPSSATTPR